MRVITTIQLPSHPIAIATKPDGVLVLMRSGDGAALVCYHPDLSPKWSRLLEKPTLALEIGGDGTCIVLDATGTTAFVNSGESHRIDFRPMKAMQAASFSVLDDGLLVAWEHLRSGPVRRPVLERITFDGQRTWSTTVPIGEVAFEGVVEMRADEGWITRPKKPWKPESWVSMLKNLRTSGDRLLAVYSEMPRSGIGVAYVLGLSDGVLYFVSKKGPAHEVAQLGDGAFLVGYQGYGAFETLQYDPTGRIKNRWSSYGYYLPEGRAIRVIEMKNVVPSQCHLTRLHPDGTVERGDLLEGYYTSRPYGCRDGNIVFFRNGGMHVAHDLHIVDSLVIDHSGLESFSSAAVSYDGHSIFCAYSRIGAERDRTHLVRVDLT